MSDASAKMILIAGPYRSGTADDPAKMAENVRVMERYALPLFRAGYLPVVGEWLALPLVALAGSTRVGDAAFDEIFHPIAERLVEHCQGCSASAARRKAPISWCALPRSAGSPSTTRSARSRGAKGRTSDYRLRTTGPMARLKPRPTAPETPEPRNLRTAEPTRIAAPLSDRRASRGARENSSRKLRPPR